MERSKQEPHYLGGVAVERWKRVLVKLEKKKFG